MNQEPQFTASVQPSERDVHTAMLMGSSAPVAAKLGAMAKYPDWHLWDKLDSQVCMEAAALLSAQPEPVSRRLLEMLRALLAKIRRDAPHLAGKLMGDAEAAIAEAEAQPVGREPLTDDEIDALDTYNLGWTCPRGRGGIRSFARAVERAHGITGEGAAS